MTKEPKREVPRDADGNRLCEYCLERPVPPSLGTKPRRYCSASHRQMAHAARKKLKLIRESIAHGIEIGRRTADSGPGKSTDVSRTSTDVPESPQVGPPIPEARPDGGAVPAERPAPRLPPRPRSAGRRRVGMTADPMPLWTDDGGEPDAQPPRRGT